MLSRLLGVSAHPDAQTLARTLAAQLAPVALEKQSGRPPAAVVVPASLSGYVVEAGSAADYDRLLVGARDE